MPADPDWFDRVDHLLDVRRVPVWHQIVDRKRIDLLNGDSSSNHPDHTSRTPVQAMKYRHKSNPALFVGTPKNHTGCDS
jgi:hypothetical protein